MKWLLPVLLTCVAAGGIWFLFRDEPDLGYTPSELRGGRDGGPGVERDDAMRAQGGKRLGVVGKTPLPAEAGSTDDWMHGPLKWPKGGRVTGQLLADALSERVPVRFISSGEMDAFLSHEFLDRVPEGEGDLGMLPAILQGSGFVLETKDRYVLLRKARGHPDGDG
ncbi:MAG: hypothetical protein QNJ98_15525 [Planctomycetota bacterium]|nr:hypothetical protein [Planctomycetota bacterium]